ncbi:MAG: glutathione peroxidase [Paucimonas sp.]|nr:glutathione peroxidase [Paucimonas sp.]
MTTVHDFQANRISGQSVDLGEFRGKVLLIVNTASQCTFTPQYKGLEELYGKYKDRGFEVLAFPCNQFGAQEPGSSDEIDKFCKEIYDVTFPLFAKVDVNGSQSHPLYQFLKKQAAGIMGTERIKWNFTKFLVRKDGSVYQRYAPYAVPSALAEDIERLLAE